MTSTNDTQIDFWNGRAGSKWAQMQVALDAMLSPVTEALKARAGEVRGKRVLDIGCGTGETCAIWLAGGAELTGVDVSQPMLAVAAARTQGKATLVEADAAVWKGEAPFDLAISRFGVMFFADPDAAFANIASNLRPGGRLLFACWRPRSENPWATLPLSAMKDLLPEMPPPVPHAPGPFGLEDKDRLHAILERAGFASITIDPYAYETTLASEGGVEAALPLVTQIGPAGAALAEVSDEIRRVALERVREALGAHEKNGKVTLPAAVWLVEARRPV